MRPHDTDSPQVKYPPPFMFILFLGIAVTIESWWYIPLGLPALPAAITGGLLAGTGSFVILIAIMTFKRAGTAVEPWRTTTAIVSTGVYAYSRNPIYLGFCLIVIGFGIFLDSLWVCASFMPALWCVYHMAIKKEETYLATKFGEDYLNYKARVRRWL